MDCLILHSWILWFNCPNATSMRVTMLAFVTYGIFTSIQLLKLVTYRYEGLSEKYLSCTAPKLLLLAGTDRLDRFFPLNLPYIIY